ncbi:hypothetical protein KAR91_70125, partial [Candidatus Pacearchaeota archaeon]|nr:hypothetical protein [Candidatus Pacearchaeota archaeon]
MKKKIFPALRAIITVVTIAVFELIFVAKGKYEIIAEWIQQHSQTISLVLTGLISIMIVIAINGIIWKNDNGKKGV